MFRPHHSTKLRMSALKTAVVRCNHSETSDSFAENKCGLHRTESMFFPVLKWEAMNNIQNCQSSTALRSCGIHGPPGQFERLVTFQVVGVLEDGRTYATELVQSRKPGEGAVAQWEHELVCAGLNLGRHIVDN